MKKAFVTTGILFMLLGCGNQEDELNSDISVPVSVQELKPQSIQRFIEINGSVKPIKEVKLKAEIAGKYHLMKNSAGKTFTLGDIVKEETELVWLEDFEYENNIKIQSQKLNLDITKQVFEKQQSLYEKGGVTLSELKNAEINYMNAKYAYDDAVLRLGKMHVKVPFTGVIVDLPYYTPSARIDAGSVLASLMDYSKLYIEISMAEKNMEYIKTGQQVQITNYTLVDDTLKGTITQLSPAIDPETRSFKGMLLIDNPGLKLRPGMFVKGEVVIASAANSIVIPKEIVVSKQNGNYVFVVEKGIAYEREIQIGLENPKQVQVISGLKTGESVVVKGFETLRNESKIKVVK
ncbi:MAG: efflux RND transporter periplasmic adaptor subunit [Bacteroidales bacterium]